MRGVTNEHSLKIQVVRRVRECKEMIWCDRTKLKTTLTLVQVESPRVAASRREFADKGSKVHALGETTFKLVRVVSRVAALRDTAPPKKRKFT